MQHRAAEACEGSEVGVGGEEMARVGPHVGRTKARPTLLSPVDYCEIGVRAFTPCLQAISRIREHR